MHEQEFIVIAKVGKPHGLKGQFILHFYSHKLEEIHQLKTFYKKVKDKFIPLPTMDCQVGGDKIIAHLEGVNSREDIKLFTNEDIYILKKDLPQLEEDEFYYKDLLGCECFYQNKKLGTVRNVVNYGTCDLFEVMDGKKSYFIPFFNNLIEKIVIQDKIIYFKDLEGYI